MHERAVGCMYKIPHLDSLSRSMVELSFLPNHDKTAFDGPLYGDQGLNSGDEDSKLPRAPKNPPPLLHCK